MERSIRAQYSEYVIFQVYDAVYTRVKRTTAPIFDAVEESLSRKLGCADPRSSLRRQHRAALAELRRLLNHGARERELQNALLKSGLLDLTCRVIQEVTMKPTNDYRGMRMDLVLESNSEFPAQIVELKRGSHMLLACPGKPTERLSRELRKAVKQLQKYGHRLDTDREAVTSIAQHHDLQIKKPELRLIAGRRLPNAHGYHLLSTAESNADHSSLQLQIYTWDGFLAELERLAD